MFNGHIDTIPGFNMDYYPFKPFIKENSIYAASEFCNIVRKELQEKIEKKS